MPYRKTEMVFRHYKWPQQKEEPSGSRKAVADPEIDRRNGYQVLKFINEYAASYCVPPVMPSTYQKIEKLLHRCPASLKSTQQITAWLIQNWSVPV